MVLNCMIIDDEIMARKSLVRYCEKNENLNIIQVCENAKEALEFLSQESVDLIFLDIEMPDISGIDFLQQAVALPQIIFTTSKTDYAFEGYEYSITDYLKKPISSQRFQQAVEKAVEIHISKEASRAK